MKRRRLQEEAAAARLAQGALAILLAGTLLDCRYLDVVGQRLAALRLATLV